VLGFVVELLLVELLLFDELLGFIPVPLEPGAFDVSVVEPVVGAAGREVSPPELVVPVDPVVPVVPVAVEPVEPVVLPETEPLVLDEPLIPPVAAPLVPADVSPRELESVEVEWREVSIELRPLARRRDFDEPCWLQSHLQSFPIESLPIVVDAVSRDVLPDIPAVWSEVVAEEELDMEPLSVAALLDVSERGVFWSAVEVVSFRVALLVVFD
jgi:hypothetical protein